MTVFWKYMRWSFEACQTGRWPKHDADGNAYSIGSVAYKRAHTNGGWLCGGIRFILLVIKGVASKKFICLEPLEGITADLQGPYKNQTYLHRAL